MKKHFLSKMISVLFLSTLAFSGCQTKTTSGSAILTEKTNAEDLKSEWEDSAAIHITLDGTSISSDQDTVQIEDTALTITQAGTYVIQGSLIDGQIIIDAGREDMVQIVLNNASIHSSNRAAIYEKQAKKTILTLAEGSENIISDGENVTGEEDAAIYCQNDLTINGSGTITVTGTNNGITSKDDFMVVSGNFVITSVNHGLKGRDSIQILDGDFSITSGGDGIKSNHDTDPEKGWITIQNGNFVITAQEDGIQAETNIQIQNGQFQITTGSGSENGTHAAAANTDMMQNRHPQQQTAFSETETVSAKGIKAGSDFTILNGAFEINSSDDAIHSNGDISIHEGTFVLSSGDDGIHADSAFTIYNGTIDIRESYEGIEGTNVTIQNGEITILAKDDGINAAGGNDQSALGGRPGQNAFSENEDRFIRISNGFLSIDASGDGIDSNGNLYIEGGTILVHGSGNGDGALDYDGKCEMTSGMLIAAGSAGMSQDTGTASTQNSLKITYRSAQPAGTLIHLQDTEENTLLTFAPSKQYQSVTISMPELEQGKTYQLYQGGSCNGTQKEGLYTQESLYSSGSFLSEFTLSGTHTSIMEDGSVSADFGGRLNGGGGGRGGGFKREENMGQPRMELPPPQE